MESERSFKQDGEINRRIFCHRVVLTSIGLGLVANSLKGEAATPQTRPLAYPPLKIEGAERVLPGSFVYFNYPTANDPAVFVRAQDGQGLAYSRKCAHRGCSIEFDSQRRCFKCPCHQGAYDSRTGHVMYGPPPRPLDQIILQMRSGGEVWAVGKRIGSANSNA